MTSPQPTTGSSGLWTADQFVRHFATQCGAAVSLGVAWYGASTTGVLSRQVNWMVLAIAGLAVATASAIAWLTNGRRRVGLRRQAVIMLLSPHCATASTGVHAARLVTAARLTNYHLATCQLVRGKDVQEYSREEHLRDGRSACAICEP